MNFTIFREYDIRGVFEKDFTLQEVEYIALSIATFLKNKSPEMNSIILGRDGRIHSDIIKEVVGNVFINLGIDVFDIGLCHTPLMYFSLFNHNAKAGLMITASHNPKEYNGIKICLEKKSVWGKQIKDILQIYKDKNFITNSTNKKGNLVELDMMSKYLDWFENHFNHLKNFDLKTVIDCGNGSAGAVIPQLKEKMGWNSIKVLYETIDGTFPNHEADPTNLKNMQDVFYELKNISADFGVGLDGDCDRMGAMTKSGYLVPGDQLLAIFSKQVLKNNNDACVVFDIKSSKGLEEILVKFGAKPSISPSGHSIIKDQMFKNNALLAGELSCHFFFNDRYFGYDDGVYAMCRLFEIIYETGSSLEKLLEEFPKKINSPEFRIECAENKKEKVVEEVKKFFYAKKTESILTIDGIRVEMQYGWGLVRASNTQPVICLRFESDSEEGLKKIKQDFTNALIKNFDKKILEREIEI